VTNLLASWIIPDSFQNIPIWILINVILALWVALVVTGVWQYPDIPLNRPLGLGGYFYMIPATMVDFYSTFFKLS